MAGGHSMERGRLPERGERVPARWPSKGTWRSALNSGWGAVYAFSTPIPRRALRPDSLLPDLRCRVGLRPRPGGAAAAHACVRTPGGMERLALLLGGPTARGAGPERRLLPG